MWKRVVDFIDRGDSFLLTTHVNPDGDAIGSELALKAFLEDRGKSVVVINSSPTPVSMASLDPDREIKVYPDHVDVSIVDEVDGVFILDVNNWEHIGSFAQALQKSAVFRVCIDHHEGDASGLADVHVADTKAAATGVLIYELIRHMKGKITKTIADAVYAALITDTGTFRFSNTDDRAFTLAADLYRAGADPFELHRQVFANKSWGAARLLGPVLSTVDSAADGRLVWILSTQDMMKRAQAVYEDTDGYIDLVRSIRGVELVLFFKETGDREIKVSLRSNGKVDVNAIAEHFGGGGHKMASGMRVDGPMQEAIDKVVRVCLQMNGVKGPPE